MAQRKKKRKQKQKDYPGWMWMLFGLAIGLSVAFAIYRKDMLAEPKTQPVAQVPASMSTSLAPEMQAAEELAAESAPVEDPPEERFTFYDMLPNFEVIIPEEEPDVSQDSKIEAVQEPGLYVLQAGSFTELADADRRRVELALQGIESRIQRVAIDDKTYHRVRIGPLTDLDELNRVRSQLRQANIDVLRIRLGD